MKKFLLVIISISLLISCNSNDDYRELETNLDSTSYSLGLLFASKMPKNLKDNNIDSISFNHFLQGVHDYFDSTNTTVLTSEQSQKLIQQYFEKMQKSSKQLFAAKFKQNIVDGNIFLDKNKKTTGVIELKKGLQYSISYGGWGSFKPDLRDTILVHFRMYNISNKLLFDSRSKSSEAIKIALDSTIQAWQEVLPLVNTGAKLKIYTTHDYAYGIEVDKSNVIEPYQTLIFDIELIKTLKGNYPAQGNNVDTTKQDSIQ